MPSHKRTIDREIVRPMPQHHNERRYSGDDCQVQNQQRETTSIRPKNTQPASMEEGERDVTIWKYVDHDSYTSDEADAIVDHILQSVRDFYHHYETITGHIRPSHGISHIFAVYQHAQNAIRSHDDDCNIVVAAADGDDNYDSHYSSSVPPSGNGTSLSTHGTRMEILVAALLHDVDDYKYFPQSTQNDNNTYQNARQILATVTTTTSSAGIGNSVVKDNNEIVREGNSSSLDDIKTPSIFGRQPPLHLQLQKQQEQQDDDDVFRTASIPNILYMISLVGCSTNGNNVPIEIIQSKSYHLLIPRWSDRLEAIGPMGVIRCYQYAIEQQQKYQKEHLGGGDDDGQQRSFLFSEHSPRPQSIEEIWKIATPERFEMYQVSGGKSSTDMISHYYDKLLHIARPPPSIVQNTYLEQMAMKESKELVEVCILYGQTGKIVDVMTYIENLAIQELGMSNIL